MKNNNFARLTSYIQLLAGGVLPVAALYMLGFYTNSIAGSSNQNVNVSANVNTNCKFSNPVSIEFGFYDSLFTNLTAPLDISGSVDISCTKGTTAAITIDAGQYHNSSTRRFQGDTISGTYLNYELYTTTGRSTVWNATVGGTVSYVASTASKTTLTIYGRIPAGQETDASNYQYLDTVVVTTTF